MPKNPIRRNYDIGISFLAVLPARLFIRDCFSPWPADALREALLVLNIDLRLDQKKVNKACLLKGS